MIGEKARATSIEGAVATVVVTFQMMSTFLPLENYLAPQIRQPGDIVTVSAFPSATMTLLASVGLLALFALPHLDRMIATALRCWPVLLFTGYAFVTLAWSSDPGPAFNRCCRLLVIVAYPMYLVQRFDFPELMKLLVRCFALAVACHLAAVVVLPQYAMSQLNGYTDAWRGASSHKNFLGAMASLGVVVVAEGLRLGTSNRLFALGVLGGLLLLLVNSRSATGAIAALLCLGIMAILSFRSHHDRVIIVSLTLAAGIAALLAAQFIDVSTLIGRSTDLTGRTQTWEAVMLAIERRPLLGYGYGFWGLPSPELDMIQGRAGYAVPHSHNNWLDVTIQLGIVGLIISTVMVVNALWQARQASVGASVPMVRISTLLLVNILIRGLTETVLTDPGTASMFWFSLACAMLALHRERASAVQPAPAGPSRRAGFGAASAVG